jgi:hypothetical protein
MPRQSAFVCAFEVRDRLHGGRDLVHQLAQLRARHRVDDRCPLDALRLRPSLEQRARLALHLALHAQPLERQFDQVRVARQVERLLGVAHQRLQHHRVGVGLGQPVDDVLHRPDRRIGNPLAQRLGDLVDGRLVQPLQLRRVGTRHDAAHHGQELALQVLAVRRRHEQRIGNGVGVEGVDVRPRAAAADQLVAHLHVELAAGHAHRGRQPRHLDGAVGARRAQFRLLLLQHEQGRVQVLGTGGGVDLEQRHVERHQQLVQALRLAAVRRRERGAHRQARFVHLDGGNALRPGRTHDGAMGGGRHLAVFFMSGRIVGADRQHAVQRHQQLGMLRRQRRCQGAVGGRVRGFRSRRQGQALPGLSRFRAMDRPETRRFYSNSCEWITLSTAVGPPAGDPPDRPSVGPQPPETTGNNRKQPETTGSTPP